MSDSAITTIASSIVTVILGLIGFATLWLKIKYGTEQAEKAAVKAEIAVAQAVVVEKKIDNNTVISTEAKHAAQNAERQTNGVMTGYDSHIASLVERTEAHQNRIAALESQIITLQSAVDSVNKNVDSTRHEFRGSLQTITNQLSLLAGLNNKPVSKVE